MSNDTTALDRHDFAALDVLNALPDRTGKVQARANAGKGILSRKTADNLVMAGKARYLEDGRITASPVPEEWEYQAPEGVDTATEIPDEPDTQPVALAEVPDPVDPKTAAKIMADKVRDAQAKIEADKKAGKGKAAATGDAPPKTNGRKEAAAKSPYSTAPVAGRIKRHGKSRRTGTMTQIEDLLHKDADRTLEGSGRYAVDCLTHGTSSYVPGMTEAKPLQARTDQFCGPCRSLVEKGEKYTEEAQAS